VLRHTGRQATAEGETAAADRRPRTMYRTLQGPCVGDVRTPGGPADWRGVPYRDEGGDRNA